MELIGCNLSQIVSYDFFDNDLKSKYQSCIHIEVAWIILQNYYCYWPDKVEVLYPNKGDVYETSLELRDTSEVRSFIEKYRMAKKKSNAVMNSPINPKILLIDKKLVLKIYGGNAHIFRISLSINFNSFTITYNKNYFDLNFCKNLFRKLKNIYLSLTTNQCKPINSSLCSTSVEDMRLIDSFMNPLLVKNKDNKNLFQELKQVILNSPDKPAIIDKDSFFSYKNLEIFYKKLSHYIVEAGVQPGDRVGLYFSRCKEFVATMLAVLNAGACFVTVDIKTPRQRLKYIINDISLKLIIKNQPVEDMNLNIPLIDINHIEMTNYSGCLDRSRYNSNASDSEAYVIFTSGSTGIPKGVSVTTNSFEYYINTAVKLYDVSNSDVVLQFSSISFDAMIEEVFPTLIAGATLVIRDELLASNIEKLFDKIREYNISILNLPTAYWKELLQYKNIENMLAKSVRLVIIGGESAENCFLNIWKDVFPSYPKLINTYGPTETTVVTSLYNVTDYNQKENCLIGKPIPGSIIYILDCFGEIASAGVIGQICIGGPGAENSYVGTRKSEKFRDIYFRNKLVGTFYLSGDLGRYTIDGNIEYIGRIDNQIKISGYRVDLDEIKKRILNYDKAIVDVMVLKFQLENCMSKKIVAFISACSYIDKVLLLEYLKKVLPPYMIPAISILNGFPKLINGKTDIVGLNKIYTSQIEYKSNLEMSEVENKIAQIWQKVLGIDIVDKTITFSNIGGNSMDTIRMIYHIRKSFGNGVSFNSISSNQLTIENLAKIINLNSNDYRMSTAIQPYETEKFIEWRESASRINLEKSTEKNHLCKGKKKNSVMLTGSTGFLGIYILNELLLDENISEIYCLVRSDSESVAKTRMTNVALEYSIPINFSSPKLRFLPADITKKYLGLPKITYFELNVQVTTVIHCAANVSMLLDYQSLKTSNVDATRRIINFIATGSKKVLHYISSLAIFDCFPSMEQVTENVSIDSVGILHSGYAQSKWIADKMVLNARQYNIDTRIYRCGRIWGDTIIGKMPKNDLIWNLLLGCMKTRCVPKIDMKLDVLPVCFLSKSIVNLILSKESLPNKIYHLSNPNAPYFSDIFISLRENNLITRSLDYSIWRKLMLEGIEDVGPGHPLFSISFILHEKKYKDWIDKYFSGELTEKHLGSLGVKYPVINHSILSKYIKSSELPIERDVELSIVEF